MARVMSVQRGRRAVYQAASAACLFWGTALAAAEESPYSFEVVLKVDGLHHFSNGAGSRDTLLSNLDLNFNYAAGAWRSFVHILDNRGGKPNDHVASAQGVDNIEVEYPATRLHDAWLEYAPEDWGGWSAKAGIYDLNSEFYSTESSGLFIHPAFGIGSELAQTGVLGPSIFPYTGLAARALYSAESGGYAQVVALDAVPGDPAHPRTPNYDLGGVEGWLGVAEAGWTWKHNDAPGKLALGLWRYSQPVVQWAGGQQHNQGVYMLSESPLNGDGTLRGFLRAGLAPAGINQFNHAVNTGIVWVGPFGRADDQLGLGVAYEHNSHGWMAAMRALGEPAPRFEMAYELSYLAKVNDWLELQPDLQLVNNHGAAPDKRAYVLGLRAILRY